MKKLITVLLMIVLFTSTFTMAVTVGTNKDIKLNSNIRDEIEEKGEVDYFNFYLSKPGSVQIDFEFDVKGDYTVKLIDVEDQKVVQTTSFKSEVATPSGRYEKSSNKIRLAKGDYQVQVMVSSWNFSDEEYKLRINYTQENSDKFEKEPNNDAKNAMLIDYNEAVTGNLESNRDVDFYMVEIPSDGVIYTELNFDINATYTVQVYSEENGTLKSLQSSSYKAKLSQNSDTYFGSSDRLRVPEGNYYFKITGGWGSSFSNKDYVFRVRFTSNSYGNYEIEPNNEAKNATDIMANVEYIGNMSTNADVDYYVVDLWDTNKITVKMNIPENAAYYVTTYKENNGELSKIKSEKFTNKDIVKTVSGEEQEVTYGRYYFKVTSSSYSNEDYTICISTNKYSYNSTTIVLQIDNPYMFVNGVSILVDEDGKVAPVIYNSRTLIPARAVIESLGGTVTWNEHTKDIYLTLNENAVKLTLGSTQAYINGSLKYLDVPATSINGRTMIPIKFVMDNFGANVIWNGNSRTVTIMY